MKTKPNEPCPCGRTNPDTGRPLKFKNCCNSFKGDLHFFVADPETNEALSNEDGRVLIFRTRALGSIVARMKGWIPARKETVLIPLNPQKWQSFQAEVPYVFVNEKDFDISKTEDPPTETAEAQS